MNQEWLRCLMDMPLEEYETFKEKTAVSMNADISKGVVQKDYSWLGVVERYLPFLKLMIEDPYALWSEEDLKKNYECRFLYTLFGRLEDFLNRQYESIQEKKKRKNQSTLFITADTSLEKQDVHYELSLTVKPKENEKDNLSLEERLLQALLFLEPLKHSQFMTRMKGASLVRSPIRRSVLLSSHDNYRKLLELSEFLDSYAMLEKAFAGKEKKNDESAFFIPYFMNYSLFFEPALYQDSSLEFLKKYLEGFIRKLVEESSIDEKTFKKMVQKLFEEEYAKKKNREKNISQIFTKSFDNYQKQTKDAIRIFKG